MKLISLILNLLLVIVIIFLLTSPKNESKIATQVANKSNLSLDELSEKYPLLAKRIVAEDELDLLINFMPLRTSLRDLVYPFGDSFAFYFEYLATGTSIGINDRDNFNPASLGKVPLAMAFYLDAEKGKEDIGKKVIIKPEQIDKNSGSLWKRGVGTEITLEEAIKIMLTESDNTAANALADHVSADTFQEVYKGLDIDFPADNNNLISAKGYSSILKALYFASVLNKDDSERILDLLTKTLFNDKLIDGIPENVKVAHKIGFWGEDLYSDCGIVYIPYRNYLLCMISKTDEKEANSRMKAVSGTVYKYVTEVNSK